MVAKRVLASLKRDSVTKRNWTRIAINRQKGEKMDIIEWIRIGDKKEELRHNSKCQSQRPFTMHTIQYN